MVKALSVLNKQAKAMKGLRDTFSIGSRKTCSNILKFLDLKAGGEYGKKEGEKSTREITPQNHGTCWRTSFR